jgi:hypothetical protein
MNQAQAVVTIAAELRLFLRPGRRGGPVAVPLDGTSSLGHVVEPVQVTWVGSRAAIRACATNWP